MKKLNLILTLLIMLILATAVHAQTKDYYPGKWNVLVMGTPNGDSKLTLVLDRRDGKLEGTVQDSTGKGISKITSVAEKEKAITVAFTAQNYDVTLALDPVDDDHVKGSLMGMFNASGVRVKEAK